MVKIGHICLTQPGNDTSEHFAALVEALDRHDADQHVLVASIVLAKRLAACQNVTVGPVVRTPVMAYCLMPDVDLAHVHESRSGQAGLLLTLTRSIPFVITTAGSNDNKLNPLTRSVLHRGPDRSSLVAAKASRHCSATHASRLVPSAHGGADSLDVPGCGFLMLGCPERVVRHSVRARRSYNEATAQTARVQAVP